MKIQQCQTEAMDEKSREMLCQTWEDALRGSGKAPHEAIQLGWLAGGRESVDSLREGLTGRCALELYFAFLDDTTTRPDAVGFIGRGSAAIRMLHPDSGRRRFSEAMRRWGHEYDLVAVDAVFTNDDTRQNARMLQAILRRSLEIKPTAQDDISLSAWVDADNSRLSEAMRVLRPEDGLFISDDASESVRILGAASLGLSEIISPGRIARVEAPTESLLGYPAQRGTR